MPETVQVSCKGNCGKTQAMSPEWAGNNRAWVCGDCKDVEA